MGVGGARGGEGGALGGGCGCRLGWGGGTRWGGGGGGEVITGAHSAKQIYKPSHSAMGIVDELCKIVCSDTQWNVELRHCLVTIQWNTKRRRVCEICLTSLALPSLTHTEEKYRAQIKSQSMSRARAEHVRQELKQHSPFVHRVEFIEALAALTSLFKEEVRSCSRLSSIK